MAGYSTTPLLQKLGIKEDTKIVTVNAPDNYFEMLGEDIKERIISKTEDADLVHVFATEKKMLEKLFTEIIAKGKPNLVLWISWYKKSSGIKTDITEDTIRAIVLPKGWVDIKVCAIDNIWSGLKIVKRKATK